MNGVFAIAGAEKWTYANHCTNYALNAVFPNYNVTAAATKEDVDKFEEPLVKMVQELDMLSSYTAGPSGKVERGSEYINSTVTGYRMDAITFIKKDLSFPPMPSDGEAGRCDVGKCCLNRPGIDEFLHELKINTYGRGDFVTVAETPGVPNEDLDRYIGRDGHFSMIFDFSYTDIDINPGDLWLHQRDWTIEEFKDKLFTNQRLVKRSDGQQTTWKPRSA